MRSWRGLRRDGRSGAFDVAVELGPLRRQDEEAQVVRALERWRRAHSRGLSAEEAARAVGASRASLYRWEKRLKTRSRRPHRQRQPTWTSALMRKIERLRADHPIVDPLPAQE